MLNPQLKAARRYMKMERIVRLEMAGFSDTEIAMTVGITKQYVSMLRRTPEFLKIRVEIASSVLNVLDGDLKENIEMAQTQLKSMVPNAVMVMKNTLLNPSTNIADRRLAMDAAKEIMDREGTLAKVSKSEIKKTDIFSFDENDGMAKDLLAALHANATMAPGAPGSIEDLQNQFVNKAQQNVEQQDALNKMLDTVDTKGASIN